jgi:NAD-dependent DNA ligase
LYCRNPSCGDQSSKKIEHFAKTLKIKGLGPVAIESLALESINDIYAMSEYEIIDLLGSQKLGEKLFTEIQNSAKAPLNILLAAFSIRLIGKTASEKLSAVCESVHDINEDSCAKAGLGPKATESLLEWIEEEYPLLELPHNFAFESPKVRTGGVVCISGKLKSFKTKAQATEMLEQHGYTVKSSVTRDVTILVNESGVESQKTTKARESGVTIVENLLDFLGETNGIA